jgi:hypothetical protein
MPGQSSDDFIKSLQGSGVILVRNGIPYFIPLKTLNACQFPDAFQKDAVGISADYFQQENAPAAGAAAPAAGQLARKLDETLTTFRVVDGVQQAIWIGMVEKNAGGKPVSKAEGSKQVLFRYRDDKKRILVDMSKGGRPSDH